MCNNGRMSARFLTIADVAEQLQVKAPAVRNLIKSGQLPAIQVGGRGMWRIEVSALEAYIQEQYRLANEYLKSGAKV